MMYGICAGIGVWAGGGTVLALKAAPRASAWTAYRQGVLVDLLNRANLLAIETGDLAVLRPEGLEVLGRR